MILDNPTLETTKENTVKMHAHALYGKAFGNIRTNVSEQLVTRPMDVFKQANVIVRAKIMLPAVQSVPAQFHHFRKFQINLWTEHQSEW